MQHARRQIDLALEAGVNTIDTADIYSTGRAEEIVGEALGSRRDDVILATKARFPMGDGANDAGLSRHHLIRACEASYGGSAPTTSTSISSTSGTGERRSRRSLGALEHLVQSGQSALRRCSNFFAGWQIMKALGIARAEGLPVLSASRCICFAGALGRVRDRALGARSGIGPAHLEPAGRRPALGQVSP